LLRRVVYFSALAVVIFAYWSSDWLHKDHLQSDLTFAGVTELCRRAILVNSFVPSSGKRSRFNWV